MIGAHQKILPARRVALFINSVFNKTTTMTHRMKLHQEYFDRIKNKEKKIELRLFDEKRRKVKVGDTILFTSTKDEQQIATTKVKEIILDKSFQELINKLPVNDLGISEEQKKDFAETMYGIYNKEDEERWGVVGIRVELVD